MYNTGRRYNTTVRYNATPAPAPWFMLLAHAQPVLVDAGLRPVAVLHAAHDIFVNETLGGEDKLTFKVPFPVPAELTTGALIDMAGRIYRVTITRNTETAEGLRLLDVEAWARWYDLAKMPELPVREFIGQTIGEILVWLLPGSHWHVGSIAVHHRRNLRWAGGADRLGCLREVERIFTAEIVWDTRERRISVIPAGGTNRGLFFLRGKNLRSLGMENDFSDTVHRLYPRGRKGVSIAAANAGVPFIEIASPMVPPPSAVLTAEEFGDPAELLAYAQAVFTAMHTPKINYACGVLDISTLPDSIETAVQLGDIVTISDEDAGIDVQARVVRLRYNVTQPEISEVEVATTQPNLSDFFSRTGAAIQKISDDVVLADPVVAADAHGLNPEFIKFFPNVCRNSGFEIFGSDMRPASWDTTGVSSPASRFDSTVSLRLAPGQFAEQIAPGLPDPAWWPTHETRISFRANGGSVRVSVMQGGAAVPLWRWEIIAARDTRVHTAAPHSLHFPSTMGWYAGFRTFAAVPAVAGGPIRLRFENDGTANVFIDAVTIEADWTGRHPSFYTPGPASTPVVAPLTINARTTSYTLLITDADGVLVTMDSATAITLTVPAAAAVPFQIGTQILVKQLGTGQVTIAPATGVTLRSADGALRCRAAFSVAGLILMSPNTWSVMGDVTT
ncbi:MAG: hypothetical protein DDT37_01622 [Firmicutes bacterium]|nr:hypothetical protein [candidate division NPL-UPA2 bacterium]